MASPSKEEHVLQLILNQSPLKQWHFAELEKQTNMTKAALNKWLKKFQKQGILKRIKPRAAFPYYLAGSENPAYQSKKQEYMLNKLFSSGLIMYLHSLSAQVIIIFGSSVRGDWYQNSDIDIFVYGKTTNIEKHKFECVLNRAIELHVFENKSELHAVKTGLLKNVRNGFIVKGSVQDIGRS